MNDGGLHEPINETSERVQQGHKEKLDIEREDEQAFLNPTRWWFASTAFPLLAGTFGPMATAFNICALIQSWRVNIPPGFGANEAHGINVPDPKWLLAINGISLALAIIANFSLLLNMAQRLDFSIAQPITIICWYLSSFLLIADISSVIHIVKVPGERHALTQAYYYAIFAAALYFMIATLLVFTVYGAWKGHYSRKFQLTMSQRTLMLQTISFMIYMLGGAGVFARQEGWQFLDAVYFTNFTLLTVGIGDYAPQTHLGRSLIFPYAIVGIVILGLVIGSIRSLVLERGRKKLGSRMIEKKREMLLSRLHKKHETDKITPVRSAQQAEEVGMSERERREGEFNLMRQVQQQTETRQKWVALLVSGGAWCFLWFIGALIFKFCEHEQGWSYFESLYFAYIALLTIGYGDYKPFSNSGKAFYVFWSLLAVPTLTIVISNMGDTVVKGIRDLTLSLGEFTLLPGEAPTGVRIKQTISRFTGGKIYREDPPGLFKSGSENDSEKKHHSDPETAGADFLARKVQDQEIEASNEAKVDGDVFNENVHLHHYLLVKEFRKVMTHLNQSPPRKYTYDEWAWFLKLMGEDENSHVSHRKPPVKKKAHTNHPDIGQAQTDDQADEIQQWSWMGNRSPLMGDTEEAEWVLERLSTTLEKKLKRHSEASTKREGEMQWKGRAQAVAQKVRSSSDSGSEGIMEEQRRAAYGRGASFEMIPK